MRFTIWDVHRPARYSPMQNHVASVTGKCHVIVVTTKRWQLCRYESAWQAFSTYFMNGIDSGCINRSGWISTRFRDHGSVGLVFLKRYNFFNHHLCRFRKLCYAVVHSAPWNVIEHFLPHFSYCAFKKMVYLAMTATSEQFTSEGNSLCGIACSKIQSKVLSSNVLFNFSLFLAFHSGARTWLARYRYRLVGNSVLHVTKELG